MGRKIKYMLEIEARRDAVVTAQAGVRPVKFHWGKGLIILNDDERQMASGSPVVVKNGSPESPITRDIVVDTCSKGKEKWLIVKRFTRSSCGRTRLQAEDLRFSAQRVGFGRYQTPDGQYTAYNAAALGPKGINAYLSTVDTYPKAQQEAQR